MGVYHSLVFKEGKRVRMGLFRSACFVIQSHAKHLLGCETKEKAKNEDTDRHREGGK